MHSTYNTWSDCKTENKTQNKQVYWHWKWSDVHTNVSQGWNQKIGETAISAMFKEFNKLDKGAVTGNPVIIPIDIRNLIAEENAERTYKKI